MPNRNTLIYVLHGGPLRSAAPGSRGARVCLGLLSPWLPFQSPFLRFPFSILDIRPAGTLPNGTENEGLVSMHHAVSTLVY